MPRPPGSAIPIPPSYPARIPVLTEAVKPLASKPLASDPAGAPTMSGKDHKPDRGSRLSGLAALLACVCGPALAAEDAGRHAGPLDGTLEVLGLKATPSPPPPSFVRRTRPDPATLDFLKTTPPHKVSPVPVKTLAEIATMKAALDAAQARQLLPAAKRPVELVKPKQPAVPAPDAADGD